jgi:hypothetical protein
MMNATVSGSFHRHMPAIYAAVNELRAAGVNVLSPSDPRIVDHLGEFLFVASDKLRSIKLVQDRHFEAIKRSHFLWIVCPDGYTGASTSAEIGAAYAVGTPVFSDHLPLDTTLQHYVRKVSSMPNAIEVMQSLASSRPSPTLMLDPDGAIDISHTALEQIRHLLTGRGIQPPSIERELSDAQAVLSGSLGFTQPK